METYREKTIASACRHALFDDRIVSIGYQGAGAVGLKEDLLLSELEPAAHPQDFSEKSYRWYGAALSLMGPVSIVYRMLRPPFYAQMGFGIGLFFSIAGPCVLLRSYRRFETAIFIDSAGTVRLVISKPGPDAGRSAFRGPDRGSDLTLPGRKFGGPASRPSGILKHRTLQPND